jgi:hydrogenase maturation protease
MRAVVLACGNGLRGDDGIAWHIAQQLQGVGGETTEIVCSQQWLPEHAENLSRAELAVFLDASAEVAAGEFRVKAVGLGTEAGGATTHAMSPERLMALARSVYGRAPARAFLVVIGGSSFELGSEFSEAVREAIPAAVKEVKALLSGESMAAR